MPSLIVVRHPKVEAQGLCYGRFEPPVCECSGELQTLKMSLVQQVTPEATRLWTSPAERCRLVVSALHPAPFPSVSEDPRLWELSMGSFEGRAYVELEQDPAFQTWMQDYLSSGPPGGESVSALTKRVGEWLKGLEKGRDHVAIAHAGTIRALWVLLGGLTWQEALQRHVPHLAAHTWDLSNSNNARG